MRVFLLHLGNYIKGKIYWECKSTKLNTGLASRRILYFDRGKYLILLSIIGFIISKGNSRLSSISWIISGQFVVQFLLFFLLLFLQSFSLLLLLFFSCFAEHNIAFIAIFHVYMKQSLQLADCFLAQLVVLGSPHPSDQLDWPPGPQLTLTLVLLVSPMLN